MAELFTVENHFSDTVARYVSGKVAIGRDPVAIMNRVMAYWLAAAMKNIKGPKSSRAQITAYMMRKIRDTPMPAARRKRAAVVNEMRNTMAMMIALKRNTKGIRQSRGSEGYKIARGVRNAASFSSGYIKTGFLPGIRARKGKTDGSQMPRYSRPAGDSPPPVVTENEIRMQVTNFAKMVAELFPNAFEDAARTLGSQLNGYILEDLLKAQNAAGLNAK